MEENQKQYELVCILSPQLEGEGLDNVKKEIEGIITKQEGSINFKNPEKKELAYPINKQGQGIYLIGQLLFPPEKISNFLNELKLNKQILRHLISQMPISKPVIKKSKPKPEKIVKKAKVESKTTLKEIDKKLDEIIKEI